MNRLILMFFSLALILSSCSTDKVMTTHAVQKRKYRPGLYISKKSDKAEPQDVCLDPSKRVVIANKPLNNFEPFKFAKVKLLTLQSNESAHTNSEKNNAIGREFSQPLQRGFKSALSIASETFRVKCRPSQDYYEEQMQPRSSFGTSGFGLGLAAVFLLTAAFIVQSYWAALLLLLALIVAIFGLTRSIKGLKDSYEFNRKGKFLSYFGLFSSATVLGISAFLVFLVLLTLIAFVV